MIQAEILKTEYVPQLFADYRLSVEISGSAKDLTMAAQEGKEAVEELAESGKKTGDTLEAALVSAGMMAALNKLVDAFRACSEAAESCEHYLAQVSTIAGTQNMGQMSDDIMALSNASGKAAEELSLTAYSALSAGSAVEDAVNDARVATELATAGFTDTNSALKVLKTATNAYGDSQKDLQHISDSLIQTQNLGVTTIAELADQMGVAIATGSAYDVSLENLEAAYIATTKAGINTANSTTYISRMISELGDAGSDVAKILTKKTGKSFGELMKEGKTLADVLGIVYDECGRDSEAMMQLWHMQAAGKASNAIISQGLETFRTNLDAVTNSAGATTKAYGLMEDTTGHAHEKMQNSMRNLSVVVGSQLNPVLEDMYLAVADMVTGLQAYIKDNPVIVHQIAALTAGLGTAVTAIAAVTLGSKLATIAVGLFNGSLATNPIFLFTTAVISAYTALAVFIATEEKGMKEAAKAITPATQEMKSLTKVVEKANDRVGSALDSMKDGFATTSASIEGNATQAGRLVDRLDELQNKTDLTAAEQAEMKSIVGQLNTLYPQLGLAIDEVTGKTNMSSEAIEKNIDSMKEMQMAQAYFDAASEAYRSLAESEIAVADAERNLNALQEEGKALQEARNAVLGKSADAIVEYNGKEMTVFETLRLLGTAIDDNKAAQEAANTALEEASTLSTEATAKADEYMQKYGELTAATETQTEAQAAGNEAQQASIEVAGQALTAWQQLSEGQQQTAADFSNSVTDLVDSTQKAINSQMDMFEKYQEGSEVSTKTLLDNMQSQIDGVTQWEQNLATLADKGINQDLLQHLADMGPKGANYVTAFNTMTDEELQKANDLWAQSVDIKAMTDEWGQQLIESGTENIAQSMGGLKDLMETSGTDTALGLARGIQSAMAESEEAADQMGINVVEAANNALGVHSPSWKMIETGEYFAQGLANGILNGMSWVTAAAREIAWAAVIAAEAELGINSPSKVARDEIGKYYGEGLALGIADMTGYIGNAVQTMVSPLMHPINTTAASNQQWYMGNTNNMATTNYGGVNVNVYGAEGQDVEALADIVSDRIIELARREA